MVKIELTRGQVALVDDADAPALLPHSWCVLPAHRSGFYAVRAIGPGQIVSMHRQIMGLPQSRTPHVDHRDGDGLNNQRANLRIATVSQNHANSRKPRCGTNRFKGVTRSTHGKPWQARIVVLQRAYWLGRFHTEEEAARAYDVAAREHFGEFAALNLP